MKFHLVGNTIYFGGNYVGTLDEAADYGPREAARKVLEDYDPDHYDPTSVGYYQELKNELEAARDQIEDLEMRLWKLENEKEDLENELREYTKHLDPAD